MALDADQLVIPGTGHVYVGDANESFPTDITTAVSVSGATGFLEMGYTTEAGVGFSFGRVTKEIKSWQSGYPLRRLITDTPTSVSFSLLQLTFASFRLAMGGGAFGTSGANKYYYEPPDADFVDERSIIIEAEDGDYGYRWLFRRCIVSDTVDFNLMRTEPVAMPLKFDVLESGTPGQKPWAFQTNDPELGQFALVGT